MKAVCVHRSGGPDAMTVEEIPRPHPGPGQVLVRVYAAGVGPWDAWVRNGQSALHQALPLTLGSDIAGVVAAVGSDVTDFQIGDAVYGVTNPQFTGGYAEYAVAEANMIAPKPARLSMVEAASAPVVACTAWQMAFDKAQVDVTKRTLVLGGAGNVGAYAVQLAKQAGSEVIAATYLSGAEYVRSLGADHILDAQAGRLEEQVREVDVVLDTVGGDALARSLKTLKPGGIVVSIVAEPDAQEAAQRGVRSAYFIVSVTSALLRRITSLFDAGQLTPHVGEVLPLAEARLAHEMLAGKLHKPGKIVLVVNTDEIEL